MSVVSRAIAASVAVLARLGLFDEERGRRIAEIAWPRSAFGLARVSKRTADFIMVGSAVGPAAVAGMGFAFAYWSVARGVGFSLANGGMTFMAQRFGDDDMPGMDLAVKQTLWIELALAAALTVVFVGFAEELIGLLDVGPEALGHGTVYLQVIALGFCFTAVNHTGSKALISANDAWTPMVIRGVGSVLNITLNAVLIFGLGLGAFGAALGSVLSSVAISAALVTCLLRGSLPLFGEMPIRISVTRPYFDPRMMRQMLTVGGPLVGKRIVSRVAQFPVLALVAQFGTITVAAYVASREVRKLMNTPGWGFSDAGRSLIGQALGADDEQEAKAYGWDTLRFTTAVYAGMAVVAFVFADQIAALFADETAAIEATSVFVRVMAVSVVAMGVDSISSGILTGGGDTRWPLYGRIVGLYGFVIPLAYVGVTTPAGILAVYLAVTAETVVPALITFYRFNTGKWIAISRRYRQTATS